jgi:hypothetical protein
VKDLNAEDDLTYGLECLDFLLFIMTLVDKEAATELYIDETDMLR